MTNYDETQIAGKLFDIAFYKALSEKVGSQEAVDTAYKVVEDMDVEHMTDTQAEAISREWEKVPMAARISKGRTSVTEGLEDGGVYLAEDSKGKMQVVRFDEYDDYSGPGGCFSLIGESSAIGDKYSLLAREGDVYIVKVHKERIL